MTQWNEMIPSHSQRKWAHMANCHMQKSETLKNRIQWKQPKNYELVWSIEAMLLQYSDWKTSEKVLSRFKKLILTWKDLAQWVNKELYDLHVATIIEKEMRWFTKGVDALRARQSKYISSILTWDKKHGTA